MHRTTRRLVPSTMIAAAALSAGAALAPASASAQTAPVAKASSNADSGMQYVGTPVRNTVRVTLAGTTFTIDDLVPIHAGPGCQPVATSSARAPSRST